MNKSGQVLIVEHVFHPEHPWGLPGGWIGRNEDPSLAVVRELEEELQLQAKAKQILHVERCFRNHLDLAYLCEASNQIGELSNELLDYRWVDPDHLPPLHTFHQKAIEIAVEIFHRS